MPKPFPEFENPPVSEMAMGVQFAPLPNFHAIHLGLFWATIRGEYPLEEDQAPVSPMVEPPSLMPTQPTVSAYAVTVPPLPRCIYQTNDKTQLIQVQRDRFIRNWRRVEGTETYPHYPSLVAGFRRDYEKFLAFVEHESLGPVNVNQCEMAYINTIERNAGWSELGELDKMFTFLQPNDHSGFLPSPELMTWQLRYKLPDGRGRLHVEMSPTLRGRDMSLVLSLNLTVRGSPVGGSLSDIVSWFDLGHEWVVRAFADLTGPIAHKLWGIRQ
jgi:uncharacterized protein (TIGR04255 family)